jgi:very-short-patch-repair endonuclease
MNHRVVPPAHRNNARRLRRDMTDAERKLWETVRAGRLPGLSFRRQVPIGRYIADFFCPEHKLILEVDGGQHAEMAAAGRDAERTAWLEANGYRVLRFWNHEVLENPEGVVTTILAAASLSTEAAHKEEALT